MSAIPTTSKSVVAGKLKVTSFKTEQERLDAFAAAMTISAQAGLNGKDGVGASGSKGDKGDALTPTKVIIVVPASATSVDCLQDAEGCAVSLINNAETPTIGILAISGSVVFLTAAAPTASYKIQLIKF